MIYISVVLFVLCFFIGMSGIFSASAEESIFEQPKVYEDKTDAGMPKK